jgi:hypothetical protein
MPKKLALKRAFCHFSKIEINFRNLSVNAVVQIIDVS